MRTKLIYLFSLVIYANTLIGQNNLCQNIYVWDFKSDRNERNSITNTLSNEVEDILTQLDSCKILQRRKYSDIQKQIDNEIQISDVESISSDLKIKLKTIQAERVLFGEVAQDFSFNVNLRLRLEHLSTKEIKTVTILIEAEKMINPSLRSQVLKNGVKELLNFITVSDISNDDSSNKIFVENEECQSTIDYFLHKEFRYQEKLVTYSYMIDIFKESFVLKGIKFIGPSCSIRGEKHIVSYHVKGRTNDGKHYDHYADFEVNSSDNKVIALTELAKTMTPFLGLK